MHRNRGDVRSRCARSKDAAARAEPLQSLDGRTLGRSTAAITGVGDNVRSFRFRPRTTGPVSSRTCMAKKVLVLPLLLVLALGGVLVPLALAEPPACNDLLDNDGDGHTDYPDDAGCFDATDIDEENSDPDCSDGADNDQDGYMDHPSDPECASADEDEEDSECDDGWDNDYDRGTDWPEDDDCVDEDDDAEAHPMRLTIRYDAARERFVGRLVDEDYCVPDRLVRLMKKRPGRDIVVDRTRTTKIGRWVARPKERIGVFYALAPAVVTAHFNLPACGFQRSSRVRVPG